MTSVLFNITDWNLFDVVQFAASFRCVSNLWSKSKSPIFWLYLHKGKPNMNPKASNWNDFYTMTDSVIICIESFIRCRLYLEMYPIQVFTLLIWFKVRLFVRKFVVRPSPSWSVLIHTQYSLRTGHVQVIYSDFVVFLEDLIYKWRYLKMFRAT